VVGRALEELLERVRRVAPVALLAVEVAAVALLAPLDPEVELLLRAWPLMLLFVAPSQAPQ